MNEYSDWYEHVSKEEQIQMELLNEKEKRFFFGNSLKFGTAGIRAKMMLGTNMLNIYTIRRVALGLVKYLKNKEKDPSVVIGFDGRHHSDTFAREMAMVLTKNDIKVYMADKATPTPFTSYLTPVLKATIGVMITASHSPKEYNGIKVYNSTGAQIPGAETFYIKEAIDKVEDVFNVEKKDLPNDKFTKITDKYFEEYLDFIMSMQDKDQDLSKLKVVYTPQHGVGPVFMKDVFEKLNCDITYVEEQMTLDPDFSNTEAPNPEKTVAFNLAIDYALNKKADLILSHDPDADRLGVMVRHNDEYKRLSGNQVAAIMLHHLVKDNQDTNKFMVKSVVSTNLVDRIAGKHNVKVLYSLTGFKNIAEKVAQGEAEGMELVLAFEEAIGYILNPKTRDKDGFQAAITLLKIAGYAKENNQTLIDVVNDIHQTYGYFSEETVNVYDETIEGAEHIKEMVDKWRYYDEDNIGDIKIVNREDYLTMPGFESSNFIKYNLENDSMVVIRPSGTEPECKYYLSMTGKTKAEADDALAKVKDVLFR